MDLGRVVQVRESNSVLCTNLLDTVVPMLLTHRPKSIRLLLLAGVQMMPNNELDNGGWWVGVDVCRLDQRLTPGKWWRGGTHQMENKIK